MRARLFTGPQGRAMLFALGLAIIPVLGAGDSSAAPSTLSAGQLASPERYGAAAAVSTPPARIRARYRRCLSRYRLVYRGSRIGCYRRGRPLRKPGCASGYHHPGSAFRCEPDSPPPPQPAPQPAPQPPPPPLNTTNPAAAATQYWSTGLFGANRLSGDGTCRYYDFTHRLRIETNPPVVYAHDDHPGLGNDRARVWYRTFLVNQDGTTIAAGNYSEEAVATDTAPATFAGPQYFQYQPQVNLATRIDIRIEWWSATALTGAVAHRVPSYRFFYGMIGPIGPIGGCAVVYRPY